MTEIHQLIRSKRRSLALIVTDEAKLVIRAPHRLSEEQILNFVGQKRKWIERKIAEISNRPRPRLLSEDEKDSYRRLACRIIPERVKYYSELTGLQPGLVKISNARKRWGSCGSKGTINISWRLMLMPAEVIDYVVVHELVHLVERNHSRRFWRRVAEIIPDYKLHRRWLRRHGSLVV
ncbi:MAG: YgjP-like metallopeptidase domain-containing protein [Candidatus Margulisiibacteriota bacterium]